MGASRKCIIHHLQFLADDGTEIHLRENVTFEINPGAISVGSTLFA
jgi:hypothetical protein